MTLKEVAEISMVLTKAIIELEDLVKRRGHYHEKKLDLPHETKMKAPNNLIYHKINVDRQHLNA